MKAKIAATTEELKQEARGRKQEKLQECVQSAKQREGFYRSEFLHFGFYDEDGKLLILPSNLKSDNDRFLRKKVNSWISAKNQPKKNKEIEFGRIVNVMV